ncbi:hypothetical protein ABW636_19305 [Aquimarina sp. 2201CG1-2-11]
MNKNCRPNCRLKIKTPRIISDLGVFCGLKEKEFELFAGGYDAGSQN